MRNRRLLGIMASVALVAAACGGGEGAATSVDGDTEPTAEAPADQTGTTRVVVALPVNSPSMYDWFVAQEAGYFADEGLEVELVFPGGSGTQQLLGGNADFAVGSTTGVLQPLEEGFTNLRAIYARTYASIFAIAVPEDSDIQSTEDFAGATIGITDLSGGEVPTVRAMLENAGLGEGDVDLLAVGEDPALILRSFDTGQIAGFGGAVTDFVNLEVRGGIDLRVIQPEPLVGQPSDTVSTTQEFIDENRDVVEGVLRALTKGYSWSLVNPDAVELVMRTVNPDQFVDEAGRKILEAFFEYHQPPEGLRRGEQDPNDWATLGEFLGEDSPDVPLDEAVTNEFIDAAHDFDLGDVEQDAQDYLDDNSGG